MRHKRSGKKANPQGRTLIKLDSGYWDQCRRPMEQFRGFEGSGTFLNGSPPWFRDVSEK